MLAAIDPDSAEATAGTISKPHLRSKALVRIATSAASTDRDRARRILSDALSAESIFRALSSLADIDAPATLEICEYALYCLAVMATGHLNANPGDQSNALHLG
jgi:hypothetical protein